MELPTPPGPVYPTTDASSSLMVKVCVVPAPKVAPTGLDIVKSTVSGDSTTASLLIIISNVPLVFPAGIVKVPLVNK